MAENMNDSLNDAAVISAFKDKTKEMFHELNGLDPETIEANVKTLVQGIVNDYGLDVTIEDVVVSGSRCRGMEMEGSDLDVVLYFSGSEREDSLFNTLHEGGNIIMGGVCLDINPISQGQTGSLSEYLTGVETYLADRQAAMEREAIEPMMTREDMKPAPVITYTVAECGEFHSQGAYRDDIPSIEEAKAIYDAIPEERRSMIPAVGMKLHFEERGYDDVQWDFMYGKRIDLGDLGFLPDISNNKEAIAKLEQLIEAFSDAKVIGTIEGRVERGMQEPELDPVKPVYVDEAAKLAAEIDRFSSDFDPYEYKDTVDNWEVQVQNMADDIRNGNSADYKKYLGDVVAESDNIEDVRKAAELLIKLAEYKPLAKVEELEEENLNQIDNYLSNTVAKEEERKEIRNTELERIEEEERKRRQKGRPSLRARLAEKKAIVAAAGANPQLEKQRQAQREAVAPQRDM